ncbi:MAG: DNA polymerase III subunit delta [Candidatus Peregrinibacteria bacterium Gr01-1014_25]|nr:MAG: DNA polymerase III subunit delta [Candidatus Peregrinibacteria bacterium Gr01-1014_25]
MANLYIFAGENDYLLSQERRRWIAEFVKRHGEDNIVRIAAEQLPLRQLLDETGTAPFLATKRLVIVEGLKRLSGKDLESLSAAIHPDVVVLLAMQAMSGKGGVPKDVPEGCDVKMFSPPRGKQVREWLMQEARSVGVGMEASAADVLLTLVGNDQGMLAMEVRKLALGCHDGAITANDVRRLAVPSPEGVIWSLTDALCAGRRTEALAQAKDLLDRGTDPFGLWAALLTMVRNVGLVSAAVADHADPGSIPEQFDVHPFAIRNVIPYARRADHARVRSCVAWVTEADIAVKTGSYRASDEAPQELHALIDRCIMVCP